MKTVLILRDRPSDPMVYLIDHYAMRWKAAGYTVIDHIGLSDIPFADIVIVHINSTVIPQQFVDVIRTLPRVINGKVLDASRRRFSQLLLSKTDDYAGPVIVKTNANYGGWPEYVRDNKSNQKSKLRYFTSNAVSGNQSLPRRLIWLVKAMAGIRTHHFASKQWPWKIEYSWETVDALDPMRYPIFGDIKNVPIGVWDNDNLIVERYVSNRHKGLYYMYYYVFFGDKEISGRLGSLNPIVKFGNCVSDELVPVPDEARQWRKDLGIDFGRFDFVESGGKYFLIDVNTTEGGGKMNYGFSAEIDFLASGLKYYMDRVPS
ncbi:MAG: hypothetical protein KDB03_19625 [Planctomycetales bacterium]|nr:hypothetical protein [Planctomycetales bacterium]